MNRVWLIKVNATIYNILGGAREYGGEIPWHFKDNLQVASGDKVFFYLTDSKARVSKNKYSLIDTLFKRFLFKGEILHVYNEIKDYDNVYWNDKDYKSIIESTNHGYAVIKITQVLYDFKIRSNMVDRRIWDLKYAKEDAYELDSDMVYSIQRHIPF